MDETSLIIIRDENGRECPLCEQHVDTTDHPTSGYPILANNEYLMRHDRTGAHLHYSTRTALSIEKKENGRRCARARTHAHTHKVIT